MSDAPLVSVCIPTFNGSRHVDTALASVTAQDHPNLEVIVVDDASRDDTVARVRAWEGGRARVFVHRRNRGHSATWNETIARSHGVFVKVLHQDDELRADCVSRMARALVDVPSAGLVFSRRTIRFDGQSPEEQRTWLASSGVLDRHFDRLESVNDGRRMLAQWVAGGLRANWIAEPSAVLVRRSALARTGGFAWNVEQLTDMELWARIMAHFDVCFIPDELATFRAGKDSLSARNRAARRHWLDRLWTVESLLSDPDIAAGFPELESLLAAERFQAYRSTLRLGRIKNSSRVPPVAYLAYARHRLRKALGRGRPLFPSL
jgi:glycosyltransferase involved in cell wall biosynthesis